MSVERQYYYPGEKVKFWLNMNNFKCKFNVESYHFKLIRILEASAPCKFKEYGSKKHSIKRIQKILDFKRKANCSAYITVGVEDSFELPLIDFNSFKPKMLMKDEEYLLDILTPTVIGKLFNVKYELVIQVKHAKNELDVNKAISLPITFFQNSDLVFLQHDLEDPLLESSGTINESQSIYISR